MVEWVEVAGVSSVGVGLVMLVGGALFAFLDLRLRGRVHQDAWTVLKAGAGALVLGFLVLLASLPVG